MHLHTCTYHASYMHTRLCEYSGCRLCVAADVAAVPRYRRGCLDALRQPSRHDLSALSTTICAISLYRGDPSLSAASSSPRSSIGDARFARLRSRPPCARCASSRDDRVCAWCVCEHRPIRREGNGSCEKRLMRSRVSLAELFHEIRVSIYESRSRRFLSLGIGRTFIILWEKIRI